LDLGCLTLQRGGTLPYRLLEVGQTALVARGAQARSTQCHRTDQHQESGRRSLHGIPIPPPSQNGIVSGHGLFIGLAPFEAPLLARDPDATTQRKGQRASQGYSRVRPIAGVTLELKTPALGWDRWLLARRLSRR
jgi:hypothetical protein